MPSPAVPTSSGRYSGRTRRGGADHARPSAEPSLAPAVRGLRGRGAPDDHRADRRGPPARPDRRVFGGRSARASSAPPELVGRGDPVEVVLPPGCASDRRGPEGPPCALTRQRVPRRPGVPCTTGRAHRLGHRRHEPVDGLVPLDVLLAGRIVWPRCGRRPVAAGGRGGRLARAAVAWPTAGRVAAGDAAAASAGSGRAPAPSPQFQIYDADGLRRPGRPRLPDAGSRSSTTGLARANRPVRERPAASQRAGRRRLDGLARDCCRPAGPRSG